MKTNIYKIMIAVLIIALCLGQIYHYQKKKYLEKKISEIKKVYEKKILVLDFEIIDIEHQIERSDFTEEKAVLVARFHSLMKNRSILMDKIKNIDNKHY